MTYATFVSFFFRHGVANQCYTIPTENCVKKANETAKTADFAIFCGLRN